MIYRTIAVTPGQPTVGQCAVNTSPLPTKPRKGHAVRAREDAAGFKVPRR